MSESGDAEDAVNDSEEEKLEYFDRRHENYLKAVQLTQDEKDVGQRSFYGEVFFRLIIETGLVLGMTIVAVILANYEFYYSLYQSGGSPKTFIDWFFGGFSTFVSSLWNVGLAFWLHYSPIDLHWQEWWEEEEKTITIARRTNLFVRTSIVNFLVWSQQRPRIRAVRTFLLVVVLPGFAPLLLHLGNWYHDQIQQEAVQDEWATGTWWRQNGMALQQVARVLGRSEHDYRHIAMESELAETLEVRGTIWYVSRRMPEHKVTEPTWTTFISLSMFTQCLIFVPQVELWGLHSSSLYTPVMLLCSMGLAWRKLVEETRFCNPPLVAFSCFALGFDFFSWIYIQHTFYSDCGETDAGFPARPLAFDPGTWPNFDVFDPSSLATWWYLRRQWFGLACFISLVLSRTYAKVKARVKKGLQVPSRKTVKGIPEEVSLSLLTFVVTAILLVFADGLKLSWVALGLNFFEVAPHSFGDASGYHIIKNFLRASSTCDLSVAEVQDEQAERLNFLEKQTVFMSDSETEEPEGIISPGEPSSERTQKENRIPSSPDAQEIIYSTPSSDSDAGDSTQKDDGIHATPSWWVDPVRWSIDKMLRPYPQLDATRKSLMVPIKEDDPDYFQDRPWNEKRRRLSPETDFPLSWGRTLCFLVLPNACVSLGLTMWRLVLQAGGHVLVAEAEQKVADEPGFDFVQSWCLVICICCLLGILYVYSDVRRNLFNSVASRALLRKVENSKYTIDRAAFTNVADYYALDPIEMFGMASNPAAGSLFGPEFHDLMPHDLRMHLGEFCPTRAYSQNFNTQDSVHAEDEADDNSQNPMLTALPKHLRPDTTSTFTREQHAKVMSAWDEERRSKKALTKEVFGQRSVVKKF